MPDTNKAMSLSIPRKTYTEKRFFEWHEDEVSVTLRNKSGFYGGGSEVFVVDGMGGGYVPMEVKKENENGDKKNAETSSPRKGADTDGVPG